MDNSSESDQALGVGSAPETVDPMIRAHILSLVSALGGSSTSGVYELGDEALACLKDLRKWLRLYDEKLNRYDVARCISEANLVKGDLLEIIASWKDSETEDRSKHRLTLACVELLVPLTWPFEKGNDQMTVNHHRHLPVLQHAQASYKSAILRHSSKRILTNIVRVALPSMATPANERTERDDGIIKLVLYFFRNLAIIEHPMPNETDTGEDINRSATVEAYEKQNILHLLLAMASEMGNEFNIQDVVLLEVVYHLVKSVDIEDLFMTEQEEKKKTAQNLTVLLKAEDDMKRASARSASTRHNRFGTTVWMEKNDGRRAFVSGQGALLGKNTARKKMDSTKKWKKPKGTDPKGLGRMTEFDMVVSLEGVSKSKLRTFVEDFLDAGFNPLFNHIRRAIDRDAERILNTNQRQFFYLIAWFLKAERVRRKPNGKQSVGTEDDSFNLVASVLNQEMLVTLNRRMTDWFDLKSWIELQAGMRCFTQILLTVQDMAMSPLEDDQEISENIQHRLFYEETTLDLVIGIVRSYTKQPFGWLEDCTEMVHVHVKMLEKYSKQHEYMFVRSRRREKAKKKQNSIEGDIPDENGSDEDMTTETRNTLNERAFDFGRFETKLLSQKCIDTFLAFLDNYKELSHNQVKRAITFFHRVFVKRQEEVLLFRLDIVEQFYRIMKDPDGMPQSHPARKEMDQFVKYYLRKLIKKLEVRPEMFVELLFTKMNNTMHYLTHGYDKEIKVRQERPAAELHIPGLPFNKQVGVAVGVLLDENKGDAVDWLKSQLTKAASERKAWESEAEARRILDEEAAADAGANLILTESDKPPHITIIIDSEERRKAIFKDGKLRLLMTTLGLEKLEHDDTCWIIPSTLSSGQLQESLDLLKKYTDDPITFEDGKLPEEHIKRKQKTRKVFDSDDDEDDNQEYLFEPGGPTAIKPLEQKQKKPRKKKESHIDDELGDELLDEAAKERRKKRKERERAKMLAIKSNLYVHDSDDESDPEKEMEFLLREQAQRDAGPKILSEDRAPILDTGMDIEQNLAIKKRKKGVEKEQAGKEKKKRRAIQESDEDEDEAVISRIASPLPPPGTVNFILDSDESEGPYTIGPVRILSDGDESEGPYTMGPVRISAGGDESEGPYTTSPFGVPVESGGTSNEERKETKSPKFKDNDQVMNDAEEDIEEQTATTRPGRGRRGQVIIDSDSE